MNEFDLCSVIAMTVVLFGFAAPGLKTSNATDEGIMAYGLIQTLVLFLIGMGGLL